MYILCFSFLKLLGFIFVFVSNSFVLCFVKIFYLDGNLKRFFVLCVFLITYWFFMYIICFNDIVNLHLTITQLRGIISKKMKLLVYTPLELTFIVKLTIKYSLNLYSVSCFLTNSHVQVRSYLLELWWEELVVKGPEVWTGPLVCLNLKVRCWLLIIRCKPLVILTCWLVGLCCALIILLPSYSSRILCFCLNLYLTWSKYLMVILCLLILFIKVVPMLFSYLTSLEIIFLAN